MKFCPPPPRYWLVAGATAPGVSHVRHSRPNQYAYAYNVVAGRPIANLAVADGAGSAPRYDEGSRLAVTTAIAAVNKEVAKGGWRASAVNPRWRRIGRRP